MARNLHRSTGTRSLFTCRRAAYDEAEAGSTMKIRTPYKKPAIGSSSHQSLNSCSAINKKQDSLLMMAIATLLVMLLAAVAATADPNRPYGAKLYSHTSKYPPPSYSPEPVYRKLSYPEPYHREPPYTSPSYQEPTHPPVYREPYQPTYKESHPPHYKEPAYPPVYKEPTYPPVYKKETIHPESYKKPAYPEPAYLKKPSYGHEPAYQPYKPPTYGPSYKKDYYCDPKKAPKCAANSTLSYCLKDFEYPEQEIKYAIDYDPLALKKYAEVADQSAANLIDNLTATEEGAFDYSNYQGTPFEKGNWVGGEGYICPSEVTYARPVRAINAKGEWRVIVQNVAYYTQTQRVETCLFAGASCRTLAPCYKSQCLQKYIYHRMLSFDPCDPYRGLFIDIYKLPSACSCHVP